MQAEINKTLKTLKEGGLILYPTDTVWGIGCDANNPESVEKIYKLKQRHDSKALICLVADDRMLKKYIKKNSSSLYLNQLNNLYALQEFKFTPTSFKI